MSSYEEAVEEIIRCEMEIMGKKLAVKNANSVTGLEVNQEGEVEKMDASGEEVLDKLVSKYCKVGGKVTATLLAHRIDRNRFEGLNIPNSLKEHIETANA